jgi:hypothetical protein
MAFSTDFFSLDIQMSQGCDRDENLSAERIGMTASGWRNKNV